MIAAWSFIKGSRAAQLVLGTLLLAAVGAGIYLWAITQQRQVVREATDAGRSIQQRDDLQETLNRTLEANNAAEAVRTDPVARHDGCLRHSRTPENC